MVRRILLAVFLCVAAGSARAEDFLPVAVWYGGGKARAPMLSREPAKEREAWRRDLKQIKALGFNTVRMWADWASTEPERGRYRLEYLDQMLDLAEEAGLKVIIQMYTDSAPEWLAARYPDAAFITHTGMRIVSQASPGFCLDHPGVREDVGRFLSAVAARVEKRRAFHAWDLWSERHIVNWVWMNFPVEFCWCPHTQQKPPVEITGDGPLLEARLMQGRGYRLLFLLNHAAQQQAGRVSIPGAPAGLQGRDLFTGERRSLPLDFRLEPRGTLALEIR